MNVREYLSGAPRRVSFETFAPGGDADSPLCFDVEVQFHGKDELEAVIKDCTTQISQRQPNGGRQFVSQLSDTKFRKFLASCIVSWRGLTYGKFAALGNFATPNGDKSGWAAKDVPCEEDNKLVLLETALGVEAWLMERVTSLAADSDRQEARAKNGSAPTPAASTSS
jgi:hypothetical protein